MEYIFIYLLFVVITLIAVEDVLKGYGKYAYGILCVVFILFAGLRPVGVDPDAENYENLFKSIDYNTGEMIEFSYIYISQVLSRFYDDVHIVFLFYAILGISLKFFAIKRLSQYYFLPLVIYFGNYFVLHDYIQIRAAVASAFLLMAIKPLSEGRKLAGFLYFVCAFFFHYSSVVMLAILFLNNQTLSRAWKIGLVALGPVGIVLFLLNLDLISALPIPYIQEKVDAYKTLMEVGVFDELSLKSPFIWLRYLILLFTLYFYDTIYEECPYLPLLMKIMGLSLLSFFMLSSISVVAGRVSELLGIVEIILFPSIVYAFTQKALGKAVVCAIGCVEFIFTLFIWRLLDFQ